MSAFNNLISNHNSRYFNFNDGYWEIEQKHFVMALVSMVLDKEWWFIIWQCNAFYISTDKTSTALFYKIIYERWNVIWKKEKKKTSAYNAALLTFLNLTLVPMVPENVMLDYLSISWMILITYMHNVKIKKCCSVFIRLYVLKRISKNYF